MFARGTTPTITFELEDSEMDLTQARNVYVTFQWAGGSKSMTKTGSELTLTANTISVTLTQQETLDFKCDRIRVQVNWTYSDGTRWSTECVGFGVSEQLLDKVIE